MMASDHQPLKTEYLHFLKNGVEFIQREENDQLNEASKIPLDRLQQLCDDDFSWSYLYELPVSCTEILLFAALGLFPAIKKAIDEGVNINQAIIDLVAQVQQAPDQFVENVFQLDAEPQTLEELKTIRLGFNSLFSLTDIFALQNAMLSQVAAMRKYGKSMSQLVADVHKGVEESFFLALHVDPTVLSCTPFTRRMSLAQLKGDREFFRLTGNALKIKWKKPKVDHEALRVILNACDEVGWLENLSQNEADKIFIKELQVYSDDGEDPARSLQKFIYRFKNNK